MVVRDVYSGDAGGVQHQGQGALKCVEAVLRAPRSAAGIYLQGMGETLE